MWAEEAAAEESQGTMTVAKPGKQRPPLPEEERANGSDLWQQGDPDGQGSIRES